MVRRERSGQSFDAVTKRLLPWTMGRKFQAISLGDPYLKTTRAKTHLDDLGRQIKSFLDSHPVKVFRRDEVRKGLYTIRFKINPLPDDLALILGDLLYCLRSALDQTVWALAKAKMGVGYPEGPQFPIINKLNAQSKKTFARYTAGVPARAVGIIKSLQPYQRANSEEHLLARLNKLCNIDKHRRIPVHGQELIFHFPSAPRSLVKVMKLDSSSQLVSVPLEFKDQMTFEPEVSFTIVFGDLTDGISCDFQGVKNIYEYVANSVIPQFARFFH